MSMARRKPDSGVQNEAAAWFARMRSDLRSVEDERRFNLWLEAVPAHRNAYTGLRHSFERTQGLADHPQMLAMRAAALSRRRSRLLPLPAGRARVLAPLAVAATVMLAVFLGPAEEIIGSLGGGSGIAPPMATEVHETATGARTNFSLDDGTLVTLTAQSRVRPLYCEVLRRVYLEKGEAYFDVMHDARRPFVVYAGDGSITAVGTEFNVYRKNGEVVVTVAEGQVQVTTTDPATKAKNTVMLNAGEQVSYEKGRLSDVLAVNAAQVTAWTSGRLTPVKEPLISFVDEFNRHSRHKLRLNRYDPRLLDIVITGSFRLDDPEKLVEYLKAEGYSVVGRKDSSGNVRLRFAPRRTGREL